MEKQNLYSDINVWNLSDSSLVADGDSVYQSAQIILSTPKGARFFRPEFGVTVHSNLFELLDDQMEMRLRSEIISALPRHDPRIKIDQRKTNVRRVPEEHRLDVDVSFNIKGLDDKFEYQGNFDDSFPALVPPVCRPFQPIPPTEPAPLIGEIGKPLVTLTPTPNSGWAPLSTVFRIEVLHDIAVKWSLSFGDGKPAISSNRILKDGYVDVPHIYTDDGAYRATLTWTNQLGEEKTLRAIVTVATLRCSAYLPLTVLLESGDVETKNFLLSPAKIPNITTEAPLSIDGSWDGTKINLVTAPTLPPNAIEGVKLLDFWADGLLTKAWVIEDLEACEDTAKDPGCGGPSSDEKVTGQRPPVDYVPLAPMKKILDWRTGYINAKNDEDVIWELNFTDPSNLPTELIHEVYRWSPFPFYSGVLRSYFGYTSPYITTPPQFRRSSLNPDSILIEDPTPLNENGLSFNPRTKTITGRIKNDTTFTFTAQYSVTYPVIPISVQLGLGWNDALGNTGLVGFQSGPSPSPIATKTEIINITFKVRSSPSGRSNIIEPEPALTTPLGEENRHINLVRGMYINTPMVFNSPFTSKSNSLTPEASTFTWNPTYWGVRTSLSNVTENFNAGRDSDAINTLLRESSIGTGAMFEKMSQGNEFNSHFKLTQEIAGGVGELPLGLNFTPGANNTGRLWGRVAPGAVSGFFYVERIAESSQGVAKLKESVKITYTII